MRKISAMVIVIVMFLEMLTAGFAGAAEGDINIVNTDNVTATGGTASSYQTEEQKQKQKQEQEQKQDAHSSAIVTSPRSHVNSIPGTVGTLLTVAPIMADGKWHTRLCDEYTVEELENMKDSSSYINREGFLLVNLFTSPIERTLRVKTFKGEVSKSAVVRLVPDLPGNKVLAVYEGSGAKGVPLDAMIAYAGLEGVHDTGELSLVVEYRARDIASLSGVGVGSGAAAAVSSADSARSGSMSVGAIVGFSEAYTKYVYDIKVKVVKASAAALAAASCVPTTQTDETPAYVPAKCSTDETWKKIKELKREVQKCTRYCYNNLTLRSALGEAYIDLYECTGDKKFLREAIYHFEVAERNFRLGHDISAHQGEASQVMNQVYYNWAGCVWETQGKKAALKFKAAKKLERIPMGFAR